MSALVFDIKNHEGYLEIVLSGVVNEHVNYTMANQLKYPRMVFDFEHVRAINSHGIRNWVNFIRKFSGSKIIYERCPAVIIDAINMVQQMQHGVEVNSFYMPFVCRVCNKEDKKLVTRVEAKVTGFIDSLNEMYSCITCGRYLEFQDDESVYFEFLEE